jgi:hypothetical protein
MRFRFSRFNNDVQRVLILEVRLWPIRTPNLNHIRATLRGT